MNGPVQVFTAIALISVPTVMFGGFSLLRLLTARRLNEFQVAYFRAGHAHAGVLLVLTLAVLDLLARTGLSRTGQWIVGTLLLAGVLAQSGGMFVHMGIGKPGQWSAGNTLTSIGAVLLAGALLTTGVAVIASQGRPPSPEAGSRASPVPAWHVTRQVIDGQSTVCDFPCSEPSRPQPRTREQYSRR